MEKEELLKFILATIEVRNEMIENGVNPIDMKLDYILNKIKEEMKGKR